VITAVFGASGSGKTTVVPLLASLLPTHAVLDWDAFMDPAAALAGRDIRQHPDTWAAYRQLVRTVIDLVAHLPVVLFTVCTPDELADWPVNAWLLLDCTDQERERRLVGQARPQVLGEALRDAEAYRSLGLPMIDTTDRAPGEIAVALARFVQNQRVRFEVSAPGWEQVIDYARGRRPHCLVPEGDRLVE
jgi:energy-coupling factor transporter ATP-binding protein EcfA2